MLKHRIIGILYRNILKKIFFKFDPENVHDWMSSNGQLMGKFKLTRFLTRKLFDYQNPILTQEIAGLTFRNPVCLSAGFDKNATVVDILPEVGFGAMELGSVTSKPYEGNPRPRLYRLIKSKALVVYYGLMNVGVIKFVERLKKFKQKKALVGISIARTNCTDTSTEEGGIQDYFECLQYLEQHQVSDFYTINISCPNTFGGEPFTKGEKLDRLFQKLDELNVTKPMFVKMPINLTIPEFDELLKIIVKHKLTGVVIGNLTKVRDPDLIKDVIPEHIQGGISGMPTQKLNNDLISYTYKNYGEQLIIVGAGGIFSAEDAYDKIKRGASFVQLITGMIFQGPQLIGEINYGLTKLLEKDGYSNIKEAIGKSNI